MSLIASTNLPINMEPPWSLSVLSLVLWPTVTPPCLSKGNLLLLRSSFLFFASVWTIPYSFPLFLSIDHWGRLSYLSLLFFETLHSDGYIFPFLLCNPMDCSLPSSIHGILQARILEWVALPLSKGSSQPMDQTQVSCIADRFLTSWATREAQNSRVMDYIS